MARVRALRDRLDALDFGQRRLLLADLSATVRLFRADAPVRWDVYLALRGEAETVHTHAWKSAAGETVVREFYAPAGLEVRGWTARNRYRSSR